MRITINIPDHTIDTIVSQEALDVDTIKATLKEYFKRYQDNNHMLTVWLDDISGNIKPKQHD